MNKSVNDTRIPLDSVLYCITELYNDRNRDHYFNKLRSNVFKRGNAVMKIMALNLNSYQEDNQEEKFRRIADKIIDEEIDAMCFSEASQRINTPYAHDHIREDNALKIICDMVNEKSKDTYHYAWDFSHFGFTIYEEGIGIITRCPIDKVECRYISKTADTFSYKSRKVMKITLWDHEQKINVYSVHLGWGDDEYEPFEYQFQQLDQWIKEEPDVFTVISGDFSNDYNTRYYDMVVSEAYIDQYLQANPEGMNDYTFINPSGIEFRHAEKLRLDYIFTNTNDYRAVDAKRFFLEGDRVSDHVAIYVELEKAA